MHSRLTATIIILFNFMCWAASARAASVCFGPGPVCEVYWKTDVVFVGLVTRITHPEIEEGKTWGPAGVAHFSIEEAFRGVVGLTEVDIASSVRRKGNDYLDSDDMGYHFEEGARYLVYAGRSTTDKWIWATVCSRTRALAEAAEDLEYIRHASRLTNEPRIYGTVKRLSYDFKAEKSETEEPMAGISPRRRPEPPLRAHDRPRGPIQSRSLKPGRYTVKAIYPKNFVEDEYDLDRVYKFELGRRGCAETNFWMRADGRIGGQVLDPEGRPAAEIRMEIIPAHAREANENLSPLYDYTDKAGRYEFRAVPAGCYLLSARGNGPPEMDYPRIYYLRAKTPQEAAVICLAEGEKLSNYNLQLSPRPKNRL